MVVTQSAYYTENIFGREEARTELFPNEQGSNLRDQYKICTS